MVEAIDELEQIGPGGQYSSWNLHWLTKGKESSLIPFVCVYNGQDDEECKQECNGDDISDESRLFHDNSFFVLSRPDDVVIPPCRFSL
jgi:hypothetical protein